MQAWRWSLIRATVLIGTAVSDATLLDLPPFA